MDASLHECMQPCTHATMRLVAIMSFICHGFQIFHKILSAYEKYPLPLPTMTLNEEETPGYDSHHALI